MYSFNSEIRIASRSSPLAIKQCDILIEKLPSLKTLKASNENEELLSQSKLGLKNLFAPMTVW